MRRKFLTSASVAALSVSAFGRIEFLNGKFEGDCRTTNDILGPFYRENAPVRADLTYEGLEGTIVNLKGRVFDEDCMTPLESACQISSLAFFKGLLSPSPAKTLP